MTDAGLHGRLADFTLEEILQLIALQQKTGVLTVDASHPMALAFESGMLVGYRYARQTNTDPLESFLKDYGYFHKESWEHIDFVKRHSKLDLTEILVNEGLVDSDELAHLQMEAAQEDIFRGMQLRDGRYQFVPGRDGLAGLKGRVRIKVDGVLMEAVRRIDEIGGLRERFFSNDLKLRATSTEVDLGTRSASERRLVALLAKELTLDRVIASARMSEFDTLSTLDQLREDGLITVLSHARANADDVKDVVEKLRNDRGLGKPVAVSLATFVVCVLLVVWQPWTPYARSESVNEPGTQFELARARTRVEAAIQLFEQSHQRLPDSLEDLRPEQWVDASAIDRVSDHFELWVEGDTWSLRPLRTATGR